VSRAGRHEQTRDQSHGVSSSDRRKRYFGDDRAIRR